MPEYASFQGYFAEVSFGQVKVQVKKMKLFFELFTNEIFEKTFVIFVSDQSLAWVNFCALVNFVSVVNQRLSIYVRLGHKLFAKVSNVTIGFVASWF